MREEVAVALDDRRLLRGLLLAHAHGAALLGALEEVARQALLVLDRRSHPRRRSRGRAYRTSDAADAALSRFELERLAEHARRPARAAPGRPRSCPRGARRGWAGSSAAISSSSSSPSSAPTWTSSRITSGVSRSIAARASASGRPRDGVAVELEVDAAEQAERALVVDHEHVLDRAAPRVAHQAGHCSP